MQVVFTYDGSFAGVLSVIFQIYELKAEPIAIYATERAKPNLFASFREVITDAAHSNRVLKGLKSKVSAKAISNLYKVFLTESEGCELWVYEYVRLAFSSPKSIETDFRNDVVLKVKKAAKQVDREVHRMHAFVRFQLTLDGLYTATITPDFNVIPLIGSHFRARYADQEWLIYDTQRNIGLHYDTKEMTGITLEKAKFARGGHIPTAALSEDELLFQSFWKSYFDSVNISARRNLKLHLQHVPSRYWKYLSEKVIQTH